MTRGLTVSPAVTCRIALSLTPSERARAARYWEIGVEAAIGLGRRGRGGEKEKSRKRGGERESDWVQRLHRDRMSHRLRPLKTVPQTDIHRQCNACGGMNGDKAATRR
jgi:hypothetical protein